MGSKEKSEQKLQIYRFTTLLLLAACHLGSTFGTGICFHDTHIVFFSVFYGCQLLFCSKDKHGFRREDDIQLFQSLVAGFGIKCPDDRNCEEIEGCKYNEGGPADTCQHRRCEFHNQCVADRPANDAPCTASCSDFGGIDFDLLQFR